MNGRRRMEATMRFFLFLFPVNVATVAQAEEMCGVIPLEA